MPTAPVAGSASATTPNTTANAVPGAGAGADPAGQQGDAIQQLAGQVREVGTLVDELGATNPALASEVSQVKQILRSMLVKAAQAATVQTQSGLSLPTAGGM